MSERRALGIPVSRAILLPPDATGDELRPALEAIDRVHGDGLLTQLHVAIEPTLDEESMYHWIKPIGIPWNIAMRPATPHPRLNLVHEIGHFLDHQAIGTPGVFASPNDENFRSWREAIQRTDAVAQLRIVAAYSKNPRAVEYADYLLQQEELWARSYAQFVAISSGQTKLVAELRARQHRARTSSIPVQWEDADFLPVEETIAVLFRELGWMT